jgi:WD40 repeat protein
VRLWDVQAGRVLHPFPRFGEGFVVSVAFWPDGRYLAAGSWAGAGLWDLTTREARELRGQSDAAARAVAFSPDGTTRASAGADGTVKLWDPATGRERCTLVGHDHPVRAVAFSPDGQVPASRDEGGTIRLWRR